MTLEQVERWYCLTCEKKNCEKCPIKKIKDKLRKGENLFS